MVVVCCVFYEDGGLFEEIIQGNIFFVLKQTKDQKIKTKYINKIK